MTNGITSAGRAESGTRPKFAPDDGFQADLGRRVEAYFRATGRSARDSGRMYAKTAVILAWWAASYCALVFLPLTWWQALPLAVSLAGALGAIGFGIQHDGGHRAYSRRRWVNKAAAMSLDLMGASSYLWHLKHHVIHHTYANIHGEDADINPSPYLRLSPHQPRRWFHRWQHLYLWPLYAISAPRWHLYGDFQEYAAGAIGPHPIPRPRGWDLAVFWGGKLASVGLMLAVPMFFHPVWVVVLFYLLVTGLLGVILSTVFQLAHCVGEADFPLPDAATNRMESSWAAHQVETTVDFARGNPFLCWYLGGLNFQVEHHLFPRVCHVHYPALSKIVEDTCREHGITYRAHRTFWAGVASHCRWLRDLGRAPAGRPGG